MTSTTSAPWRQWGDDIEPESIRQMERACSLPIAVRSALMPDAHLGYGLPIGGVLILFCGIWAILRSRRAP